MSRNLDLYAVERRSARIAFGVTLWLVQHSVLARFTLADWAHKARRWTR